VGDLGLPIDCLRGFALLARTAGLIGHLAEEREHPIGPTVYAEVDRNAAYRPPEF
jgi:citrate synthase